MSAGRLHERGAALLAVLMLVGVMAAIVAAMLDRSRTAERLAANLVAREQGLGLVMVAETLALARLDRLGSETGRSADWVGQPLVLPLPGGTATVVPRDGGTCFNLNGLVSMAGPEALVTRPLGMAQFVALMQMLGVPEARARPVAAAAADWIDSDQSPLALGAEDSGYQGFRTGGTLMAEASELRAVKGVTPELYRQLRPYLCALPVADLSPLNLNALRRGDAPLLAMLLPETLGPPPVRLRLAERLIAERPRGGWSRVSDFANAPLLRDTPLAADALQQLRVRTEWWQLALEVARGDRLVPATLLVDGRQAPARVALRRFAGED
jgi:general secretion pathway protein K